MPARVHGPEEYALLPTPHLEAEGNFACLLPQKDCLVEWLAV